MLTVQIVTWLARPLSSPYGGLLLKCLPRISLLKPVMCGTSYGVLCYEFITRGKTPYGTFQNRQIKRSVSNGYRLPKSEECPDDLYHLMLKCWNAESLKRPSFQNIYQDLINMKLGFAKLVIQRHCLECYTVERGLGRQMGGSGFTCRVLDSVGENHGTTGYSFTASFSFLSLYLSLSLHLLSLSLTLPLSLSLSLSFSLSLSLCLFISLSVSLYLSLSLYISLCLFISLSVSLYLSLSLYISLCLFISLSVSLYLSLSLYISLCLFISLSVSLFLSSFSIVTYASLMVALGRAQEKPG
eukprot:sb/3467397/